MYSTYIQQSESAYSRSRTDLDRVEDARLRRINYVDDRPRRCLQVKHFLVLVFLVTVQPLDGCHILGKLFVCILKLFLDSLLILFEIGI